MTDGATLPTCPNNDEPALLLKLYGRPHRKDRYVREGRPELEINTDWTGHAKPGDWYGRYYADWDAAHPGAWVRGELVPGGFYGGN